MKHVRDIKGASGDKKHNCTARFWGILESDLGCMALILCTIIWSLPVKNQPLPALRNLSYFKPEYSVGDSANLLKFSLFNQ